MPSMNVQSLKETRAAKKAEMVALIDKAATEKRDFADNERARFDALDAEIRTINDQIGRAEKLAEYERFEARSTTALDGAYMRDLRSYSLAKAIRESGGDRLTGLEAERHAELSRGRSEVRGVMVDTAIILGHHETRALTVGGSAGNMVATNLAAMTDRRRPALMVESLGATVLRGLTGTLDLPRLSASGTAHWVAEGGATTQSDATFQKKTMGPKTVSAQYEMSRRLMLQSNEAIEPIIRADMALIMAAALDTAAIKGGGTNEPTGIMSEIAAMADAAINSDTTADMIAALETDDVSGTRAFLTHPRVMQLARKLKDNDDLPIPLATTFHGERVETSTQVPIVTAQADGPPIVPATRSLIFGEWASLYIGYWSGVDLLLNPYHSDVASKGGALLHAFLDADVVVRHAEAFRWLEVTNA